MTKEQARRYKVPVLKIKMVRDNRGGEPIVLNSHIAAKVFQYNIGDIPYEEVWALMVNVKSEITSAVKIGQGGAHGLGLLAKDILLPVILSGAAGFVLGHNHPSGDATPSREDIELTRALSKAAETLCVPLLDHIVIAQDYDKFRYKSLFELGLM